MNEASQRVAGWLGSADAQRAADNRARLAELVSACSFSGAVELVQDIKTRPEWHVAVFKQDLALGKAVERAAGLAAYCAGRGHPLDEFTRSHEIANLAYLLMQGYGEAGAPPEVLTAVERLHRAGIERYLTLCAGQVDALCRYLAEITAFVEKLALGNSRVVLVELPVGNSLPSELLMKSLRRFASVETLRVALSRNDSARAGITRKELLAEKLAAVRLRKNDIVLYLDEWNTGANFHNLCELLRKLVPPGAFFLPAAILTGAAASQPRYATYCQRHDKLLLEWGRRGEEFRRVLPPLETRFELEGYFFWAEHDRMAGYRKMQVHGSLFSSFDHAIERLRTDAAVLEMTAAIQVAEIAQQRNLPTSAQGCLATLQTMFLEAYEDYRACRDELRRAADAIALHEFPDGRTQLQQVVAEYARILEGRPAKLALVLATAYQKRLGGSDPIDQYYFKEHPPIVDRLTGRGDLTHAVVLEFLDNRLRALRLRDSTSPR